MTSENKKKNLNEEIKEILKEFPRFLMWREGDLLLELNESLKSKSEYVKECSIKKYNTRKTIWKNNSLLS